MEGYMTALEASEKWDVTESAVKKMIATKRVEGVRTGKKPNVTWMVPIDAEKPTDRRRTRNYLPIRGDNK